MANYIIIGGHGKVALLTVPLLVQAGHNVTSVIRNPEQRSTVEASGAKALVLDVENVGHDELAAAFGRKDAIIWSAGAGGGNPPRTYAVDRDAAIRSMDAALQAGVQRYVMVSYLGAKKDHGVPEDDPFFPYAEAKAAADDHLHATSLDWTILKPGKLTLSEPSGKIRIVGPKSELDSRDTSRGNVARAILAALNDKTTIGKDFNFVDGEDDIAEALARRAAATNPH